MQMRSRDSPRPEKIRTYIGTLFLVPLILLPISFMILKPLGISFLRLAIPIFFKGKACYTGRLGTSRKTVHFQNKRDISKLLSAVLQRLTSSISLYQLRKIALANKCAHFFLKIF